MKLRVSLLLPDGGTYDVTLACDVTATVSDLAHTLISLDLAADPLLPRLAAERLRPVTVRGYSAADASPRLLDPGTSIAASGLQSGWTIEPVAEFAQTGAVRVIEPAGYLEVLSGQQEGALYSLLPGANPVGRDLASRVYLGDRSVSRRHAEIEIDAAGGAWLRDLGSANGTRVVPTADGAGTAAKHGAARDTANSKRVSTAGIAIRGPTELQLGEVTVRFTPGPPSAGTQSRESARHGTAHRALHVRAPRIDTRFPATTRTLPAPPAPATPTRIPMLALLAPALMGGVLFAVTASPMSLMMAVFSPVMMLGAWVDNRFGSRRKLRAAHREFHAALAAERAELEALLDREIEVRGSETPTVTEVAEAALTRSGLLWARRPEHPGFLELRFGAGRLESRTRVALPERGDSDPETWSAVRALFDDFGHVDPAPVLERLDRCGSIGVAGEPLFAAGLARSLVLQLAGLHSPEELVIACFASPGDAKEWGWLKWLPHVDTVTSPIAAWQLADDEPSSMRLLIALEGLIEARGGVGGSGARAGEHPHLPVVVALVLTSELVPAARLIALAEDGPAVGLHVIWVAQSQAALPAACRTFAVVGDATGEVGYVREGARVPLTRLELVDTPVAVRLARALAPLEDAAARALDESDLPRAAQLRDIHPVDLSAGPAPILTAWERTMGWVRGVERDPVSLVAPVGQGPDGPAEIDLRLHGPHALVGGTTGAGKSEFLQSWIMSLATLVSPERLTFLLVDYKGGAAFAECVELPHTVGLVTDLSPHLVRRALTSLRAELRYREELLAEHGAKDLATMERRSDPAAPPTLVIVVDEFAALASEVPEFVDGVVDVAQRGRSLGLHLILATQRPAGVIKDNLRANTNLRVALRMADEADSSDVIGVKDAAFFDAATPGRGAIKIGPGQIAHFQAGYLGGRQAAEAPKPTIELRPLGLSEGPPIAVPRVGGGEPNEPAVPGHGGPKPPRDIELLRDGIALAALAARIRAPRRPWLDALPEQLDLEDLTRPGLEDQSAVEDRSRDRVAIGLRDLPEEQAQLPAWIDLEHAGHIAIFGASGAGKTSALIALAAALSSPAREHPVELYAIDAAGGALDAIRGLPTVGAVAQLTDTELVDRVLQRALGAMTERAQRFAAARCSGLAAYRRTRRGGLEPRIVVIIDGFAALRQAAEAVGGPIAQMQQLTEIMSSGRAAGVHVVLTADRPGAIPTALSASVQQQFVLRLANPHDYAQFGVPADVLEEAPPGRAVLASTSKRRSASPVELQFGLIGGAPELQAQAHAVQELGARLRAEGVASVPEVRNAPDRVPLASLPAEAHGRPVYGISTEPGAATGSDGGFTPATLPVAGLGVIAGPSGAGLSTAAATCAVAYVRWATARGDPVRAILLTLAREGRPSNDAPRVRPAGRATPTQQAEGVWDTKACGESDVAELARTLTIELGGKPPRPAARNDLLVGGLGTSAVEEEPRGPDPEPVVSAASQPDAARTVIVVERPAEAEGTAALPELVALAKAARRAHALVLFECEQGTTGAIWDLFAALKQPTWGLALQPDEGDTQSPFREQFGRVKRANFVPGRGFAVERGRVMPVHVAIEGT